MSVTNEQLLAAIIESNAAFDQRFRELNGNVDRVGLSLAGLEAWKTAHEKRVDGLESRLEKNIDELIKRTNLQGFVIGLGEVVVATFAFLRGGA